MSDDLAAGGMGVAARAATWEDADALAATLARAFFDDPFVSFILNDETQRQVTLPSLFKLLFKLSLPHGACDVTPCCEAASLWRPPGAWKTHWWEYLENGSEILGIFGFGGVQHVIQVMNVVESHHPNEPHWYLLAVGTDPAEQGKGFGGAVIRSQLANADASGLPSYLETSKDANVRIYRSFGFEVRGEFQLPGGPTVWPMWREVRALHAKKCDEGRPRFSPLRSPRRGGTTANGDAIASRPTVTPDSALGQLRTSESNTIRKLVLNSQHDHRGEQWVEPRPSRFSYVDSFSWQKPLAAMRLLDSITYAHGPVSPQCR